MIKRDQLSEFDLMTIFHQTLACVSLVATMAFSGMAQAQALTSGTVEVDGTNYDITVNL